MSKKISNVLSQRRPRKPVRRISPSTVAAAKRVASRAPVAEEAPAPEPVVEAAPAPVPAPEPVVEAAPEPAPAPEPVVEAAEADLSILDLSVTALSAELETGKHDGYLADLLAAETAGKNRKGALSAIQSRMS